ncbi:C-GCAxxG-C-C family protein [Frisingicoccus sp.]|uniref:C-GCAxxG-C-C family protein n=1 Tax=Frisingicoccus sp. TaxID=1918627 RepID=UPI002EC51864|nr:C-GCAxxG-C-C family protein [Frisingicoccus sp.]
MSDRIAKALANHDKNFNCCQSVACAYCDLVGVDEETMFKAAEAFGLGMGGMEGTCGAIAGAVLLAGFKNSSANLEHPDSKGQTYKLSAAIVKEFLEKNGATACRDLKGKDTGVILRTCPGCIEDAAAIAEKILELK